MSDGNPAEPFTPEDVELVARASQVDDLQWDMLCARYPAAADSIRRSAEKQLAALASAGRLLPADATEQWSIRYVSDGSVLERNFTEAGARHWVATEPDRAFELVRRWVGPWLPADPAPAVSPVTEENPNPEVENA